MEHENKTREDKNRPVVVLAAGGKGTRIQCLNSDVPKPMIPIAGKPILQWEIECLVSQGFKDIIITVSHLAEKIIDYFGDGANYGAEIRYYHEKEPLGNAGALYKLWSEERLTDTFLFLISDAIYDVDFDRFLKYHKECKALASLLYHPNSHPKDSSLLILEEDGRVVQWLNKEEPRPKWYKNSVNAGLQILTLDLLKQSGISPFAAGYHKRVDLDRDVLKPLVGSNRIYGYHSTEYCKDCGTPERFRSVERDIRTGLVHSRNLTLPQKAIFFDCDGMINKYVEFSGNIEDFNLLPGISDVVRLTNESGYLAIVFINQSVIAKCEMTMEQLTIIQNKMETLLGNDGAYIDALYCTHYPGEDFERETDSLKINCNCSKTKSRMLYKAARDFNIDLKQSWMIGNGERDIQTGKAAGRSDHVLRIRHNSHISGPSFTAFPLYIF